jgi:protein tyrosine/serine phosphatase
MTRVLAWDGCVNVRDLGGLPLEDGGETAVRVVVRSDSVRTLTDAGWDALARYGVGRIVDLRWAEELAEDEPRELDVEVVHVPLFGRSRDAAYVAEFDELLDATEDPAEYYRESYLASLERFRVAFGEAVAALAEPDGPVVVHCAGGKDRTGLVSALALRLAGVPAAAVADDWALSEASWAPHQESWVAAAPDPVQARRRRIWSLAPREAMVDVLDALDRRHGGAERYLREAGVGAESLARLRTRLRGGS